MKNMINYLEFLFTKYSESTRLLFLLDRSSLASRRENCCETVGYKELLEEYNKFSGKAKKLSDVLLKDIFDAKGNFICTAWLIEDEKGFFFFLPGTKDMRFCQDKESFRFRPAKFILLELEDSLACPRKFFLLEYNSKRQWVKTRALLYEENFGERLKKKKVYVFPKPLTRFGL